MILREDDERPCPPVIRDVLVGKDGWSLYDESVPPQEQPPPNLFWKTNRFYPSQIDSLKYPYQRCNHYPKSSEITKKDGLYRHMKRMRVVHGASLFGFFPETYNLPNEYVKFCQYFADERDKAQSANKPPPMYIVKPSDLSRGRKIFVFNDIGELSYDCTSVVQKYIDRPLLIFGHKVDFRIYVLVTSFQPLRCYMHTNFLTRFGGEPYNLDSKDTYVHLTNYSVTKTSTSDALRRAGVGETCKWDGTQSRSYFAKCGVDFELMRVRIGTIVQATLLSICHLVPSRPQCFELYGFDILFDESLRPWLIEANFSPALAVESGVDERVKHALIHDLVATLNIPQGGMPVPPSAAAAEPPATAKAMPKRSNSSSMRSLPPVSSRVPRSSTSTTTTAAASSTPPVAPPARSRSSRPASNPTSSSTRNATAGGGGVELVDAPHGGMELLFPFNEATERLSKLAVTAPQQFDATLKAMFAEVRKRDASAAQALSELAPVYAARSQEQASRR